MGQVLSRRIRKVQERPEEHAYVAEKDATYLNEPFTKEKPVGKPLRPRKPSSVQISAFNHAAVEAKDPDKMHFFYHNVLGFPDLPRPDLGFKGYWLSIPGGMLHIIEVDPSVPRQIENWKDLYHTQPEAWFIRRATHLSFEVADFDQAERALREHGVEYSKHVLPEAGVHQLFFYDPEGHGIELGQYDASRSFLQEHGAAPPS